jgi:hypothetical protein
MLGSARRLEIPIHTHTHTHTHTHYIYIYIYIYTIYIYYFYLSIYLSIYIYIFISMYPSIDLSIDLSIYPAISLSKGHPFDGSLVVPTQFNIYICIHTRTHTHMYIYFPPTCRLFPQWAGMSVTVYIATSYFCMFSVLILLYIWRLHANVFISSVFILLYI